MERTAHEREIAHPCGSEPPPPRAGSPSAAWRALGSAGGGGRRALPAGPRGQAFRVTSIGRFLSGVRSELATPLVLVTLRAGGAVAAFLTSVLMARTMDAAEVGIALTCMSVASLSAILVTGSTEAGCVRFVVAYLERGESARARGMVRFNRRVTLVIGLALLASLSVGQWHAARGGEDLSPILAATVMTAVLLGWLRIGAAHAMALGEVIRSLAPSSFFRQAFLLLGLALWTLAGRPSDVAVVLSLMLLGAGIALVLQTALNRGPMMRLGTGQVDGSDWKEWTGVGLQLGLALLFVQFSRDLTLVAGALSLSAEDVGVLGIATAIVGFAKFLVVAINQSVLPELSRAVARGDMETFMRRTAITNHLKFWPMVLVFVAFWMLGEHVAALFGPGFADIASILPILMLEPLALAFFGPGGSYLSLSGRQAVLLPLSIATIALLAAAVTLGAHLGGLRGAALGSSVAWVFWSASLAALSRRYAGRDITLLSTVRHRPWSRTGG